LTLWKLSSVLMAFTDSESCAGLHAEGNIAGSTDLYRLIPPSTNNRPLCLKLDEARSRRRLTNTCTIMYTLLRGLCKYVSKKDEYSVLILGLDDAGKTTYLEQTKTKFNKDYKAMPLNKITSTVVSFIPTHDSLVGQVFVEGIVIKFWDLGGQTELQSLWDKYYLESHGIIFVVDSSEPERFDEAKAAFDTMIKNKALEGLPLLILANKQDLDGAFPVSEVKQVFQESAHLIGQRDCSMRGASALLGIPFEVLVRECCSEVVHLEEALTRHLLRHGSLVKKKLYRKCHGPVTFTNTKLRGQNVPVWRCRRKGCQSV
uniref:ADP-ribosylation factor-related protein 1 n=1 Tax=Schistocephalus solidus TaxID=70667 RepID=A0A183SL66_SCHSO